MPDQLMEVAFVVAVAENGVIGRDNGDIPWRIKTDIRHYKEITMGHPIIMGRKTHESIGKPLPGRLNIVMTRDHSFRAEGCVVVQDATEALRVAQNHGSECAMVIGGGQIYANFLPVANTIYLTRVHASPEGEAHFTFDESEWERVSVEEHPANPEAGDEHPFTFITLKRR